MVSRVADIFGLSRSDLLRPRKYPLTVKARSVLCYWVVRELGVPSVEVARKLGLCPSAVTRAAERGEKLTIENHYSLVY